MTFNLTAFTVFAFFGLSIVGCTHVPESQLPEADSTAPTTTPSDTAPGTLALQANGEDFVRQGFESKDGWQIRFDHVYVNLTNVIAYQSDPPFDPDFDPDSGNIAATDPSAFPGLQSAIKIQLVDTQTVDLAAGDTMADPILVGTVTAPTGRYNALTWSIEPASSGPAIGQTLQLIGSAEKGEQTLQFTLNINQSYAYACGDYIGAARKGILAPGDKADLEVTFHFDHLFGDGTAPLDDDININALGFDPLAALTTDNQLDVNLTALQQQLSTQDYQRLTTALAGLGHVGEGHCAYREVSLN